VPTATVARSSYSRCLYWAEHTMTPHGETRASFFDKARETAFEEFVFDSGGDQNRSQSRDLQLQC
jgi:hypothetical protein